VLLERWQGVVSPGELALYKLNDWGELVINTSAAKLPAAMRWAVAAGGAAVPLAMLLGARQRRRLAAVDVYMASYCAILLVWPYQDARFWIPVFPLLLGYAGLAAAQYTRFAAVRWTAVAYLSAFGLLGLVALAYSTWISLAHDRFPERFAGGVYRASYHAAWAPGPTPAGGGARVDPQIVRLVQRYSQAPR